MPDKFKNKYRIKSARLAGYDYRNEGLYFVTICTKNKFHYFGEIENGNLLLNEIGLIAHTYWAEIPQHFDHVSLDEFVIMPDHMHGIICIDEKREIIRPTAETYNYTSLPITKNQHFQNLSAPANSLSTIIRSFKSAVTIGGRKINPNFEWQSRFHDHIIRDVQSLDTIRNYIKNNPANWRKNYKRGMNEIR
jgi:REP element-mobilizing transposase RayT